jgi:CHAD domain-containing protein
MSHIGLGRWLQHLLEHLPIAREGHDPEGVHQVRVAVRRLRVWLQLAGMQVLEDDLAWLVRAAGQVRDLEVLLQHPNLPAAFQKWARVRWEEVRAGFIPVLDSPRLAGLLQALAILPPLDGKAAESRLERFTLRVERRAEEWRSKDSIESLHALRRALRRLRYAREWLGQDSDAVKALQEIFGQVGDLSFILTYLEAFETEGGRVPFRYRKKLETDLAEALTVAKKAWKNHQDDLQP